MTSDPWSQHTAEMIEYARRLARGEAEDIPAPEPLKWWQGPRWETNEGSGYSPEEYGRPRVL
jgi:hypothetical protein